MRKGSLILIGFTLISFSLIGVHNTLEKSNEATQIVKRSPEWIVELHDNADNPQWFFDNLNDTERLMIRQALDYAIPRDNIVNRLGLFGSEILIPNVPLVSMHGHYYNSSIPVTEDDRWGKAYELLAQIFGYYNWWDGDDIGTPYLESETYFPITITALRGGNFERAAYTGMIANSWRMIGIDAKVEFVSGDDLNSRLEKSSVGIDAYHGGLDSLAIGWGTDPIPDIYGKYHSSQAHAQNLMYLNDSYVDELLDTFYNSTDESTGLNAIMDFQDYFYKNTIKSMIWTSHETFLVNKDLDGFNPILMSNYNNLTHPTKNKTVFVVDNGFLNLNPIYKLWNEGVTTGGIFGTSGYPGIFGWIFGSGLFTIDTDQSLAWNTKPYLLKDYNVSSDGLTWTMNLHDSLIWHDGYPLNASDVKFTFESIINKSLDPAKIEQWIDIIDNSSISILNETAVEFKLLKTSPFFIPNYLTFPLIPEHILSSVPVDDWVYHYTNQRNSTIGPLGYGPYKFKSFSDNLPVNETWTLEKWDNNSVILGETVPTINEIDIVYFSNDFNPSNGLTDLYLDLIENNTADFVSTYWLDKNAVKEFKITTNNSKSYSISGFGYQEIGYNHGSSIWGMNPIDPSIYPPEDPETVYVTVPTTFYETVYSTVYETVDDSGSNTESVPTPSAAFGNLAIVLGGFLFISVVILRRRRS